MEGFDLKNIWKNANKNEAGFRQYSMDDIREYRKNKSNTATVSSSRLILFDIIYKSVIILGFIYLLIVLKNQFTYKIITGIMLAVSFLLMIIEIGFIKKLKFIKETDSVLDNLKKKLHYLKTTYLKFVFTSSISNSFFFAAGIFIYCYHKYGKIQISSPHEDPVLYLMFLIAYAVSLAGQWPFYKNQIHEIKESIEDFDDTLSASIKIKEAAKRKIRFIIAGSIFIILGIFILLLILFQ